jgi:hypothetical protein
MYGYEELIELSPEQLLQKVTQESIFEFVLEHPFSYHHRYTSPFRKDTKPDCRFEQRTDGIILFVDFGERSVGRPHKTHRSCFAMVMDRYNVNLSGAIKIICQQFHLSTSTTDYQPVNPSQYTKVSTPDELTNIRYEAKPYQKSDILWWSSFLIKPEELLSDGTFNIRTYWIKKSGKFSKFTPYSHCYAFDFVNKVKIYQPYSQKYKWITNCTEDDIGNVNNINPMGGELIIKKSYKDHRVIRNLLGLKDVVWVHNEGCIPSIGVLRNLIERFDLLTFFYDNDPDGIEAAKKITAECNKIKEGCARYIHLPLNLPYKDPAQMVSKEGRQDSLTVLHQIGL